MSANQYIKYTIHTSERETAEGADYEVNPVINHKKLTALLAPGCQWRVGLSRGMLRINLLNEA